MTLEILKWALHKSLDGTKQRSSMLKLGQRVCNYFQGDKVFVPQFFELGKRDIILIIKACSFTFPSRTSDPAW